MPTSFSHPRLLIGRLISITGILLLGFLIFHRLDPSAESRTLYVVDTSLSMAVEDVGTDTGSLSKNRLDLAKAWILSHQQLDGFGGILSYARSAGVVLPFTHDRNSFHEAVTNLIPTENYGGSAVSEAFTLIDTLYKTSGIPTDIALLTDGGDTSDTQTWPPLPAGSHLTIVGIGSDTGDRIPLGYNADGERRYKYYEGREVVVPYDGSTLEKIRQKYHADIIRLTKFSEIVSVLPKSDHRDVSSFSRSDLIFLFPMVLIIFSLCFHPFVSRPIGKKHT